MLKSFFLRAVGLGLLIAGPILAVSCSDGGGDTTSTTSTGTGADTCEGGVVIDGECRAKCTADKCVQPPEGETWRNTCVENGCKLVCASHTECFLDGTQNCDPRVEDNTASGTCDPAQPQCTAPLVCGEQVTGDFACSQQVNVCVSNGKIPGFGKKCPFGNECDGIMACPNGMPCGTSNCGGNAAACIVNAAACFGVEDCAIGVCNAEGQPYHGQPCSVTEQCPANECASLSCLTTGEGDAEAYCTRHHCKADADCPGGYWCGVSRDPHVICGSSPEKPQDGELPCIDPAQFTANGQTFQEGPVSALRNTCRKREACAPCATDLDCSQVANQKCTDINGSKHCTVGCATDVDCEPNFTCQNAQCIPRFGACKGTGQFCHPCVNDLDCAAGGPNVACFQGSGNERMCFDLSFPDTCTTDSNCPSSPSGSKGECLDEPDGVNPGSGVYHRCYIPISSSAQKSGCWYPP